MPRGVRRRLAQGRRVRQNNPWKGSLTAARGRQIMLTIELRCPNCDQKELLTCVKDASLRYGPVNSHGWGFVGFDVDLQPSMLGPLVKEAVCKTCAVHVPVKLILTPEVRPSL